MHSRHKHAQGPLKCAGGVTGTAHWHWSPPTYTLHSLQLILSTPVCSLSVSPGVFFFFKKKEREEWMIKWEEEKWNTEEGGGHKNELMESDAIRSQYGETLLELSWRGSLGERLKKENTRWQEEKGSVGERRGEDAKHVLILCRAPISNDMKPPTPKLSTALPRTEDTNGLWNKGLLALTWFDSETR